MEKQSVTLECEINKPNKKVTWKQNGDEIVPEAEFERFKVNIYNDLIVKAIIRTVKFMSMKQQ